MRRALALALVSFLLLPAGAMADSLRESLSARLRAAGPATGGYVEDLTAHRVLFSVRADAPRTLASNTKLFTTATALEVFGPDARFETTALTAGGDLYLRGGGDPTFGSSASAALVQQVLAAGLTHVTGRVIGDESLFDTERGTPGWQINQSPPGPIGALTFDRGRDESRIGKPFDDNPALAAAQRFEAALEAAGVMVDGGAAVGVTPPGAVRVGAVSSPPVSALVRLINKPSDNFIAETLAKDIAARVSGRGTRSAGAAAATRFARRMGVVASLADGSGAIGNRAAPREIAELLTDLRAKPYFPVFFDSLPIAGRDGTLERRMTKGRARDKCHAKTGTLDIGNSAINTSNLSGFCRARNGHTLVFSFLMNDQQSIPRARALQNRMAEAVASYR